MIGRGQMRFVLAIVSVAMIAATIGATSAGAEPGGGTSPPFYDGEMGFPAIGSLADPEDYSWQVHLGPRQTLRSVDEHQAEVAYEDGVTAFLINAEKAHAADGTNVPTTLEVSEGDVITLVVHHRDGSYAYPVRMGEGWTGGRSEPTIVKLPPDETEIAEAIQRELEEAKRRVEEANPPAATSPLPNATCAVPMLHGLSLAAAKAHLRMAHCSIGQVHLGAGATAGKGRIVKQFRAAGTELAAGAPVAVKLGAPVGR
jgi:hypothetical protein